ncbi:hypothetical protein [Pedobacter namyangjuensis]|uniref:hypothetical protein n=1 Tax=Pedobacter namyangjuensis TaxID=600626 RepID=UPI000DE4C4BF|nr:hypothetical protein [Pedobacter namyangjuensis]
MTNQTVNPNNRLKIIFSIVALILAIPLVAMQFTNEVKWSFFDFVIMGALLTGTGLAIEFTLRKIQSPQWRAAICFAILLLLFLVWAELAVGVFGTPFAGS